MSGPLPTPTETPETLHYRHLRTISGLIGMIGAVGGAVLIQITRAAHQAALEQAFLAKGLPVPAVTLPTTALQITYQLIVPVGLPVLMFVCSFQMFDPKAFGQLVAAVRSFLPWNKGTP